MSLVKSMLHLRRRAKRLCMVVSVVLSTGACEGGSEAVDAGDAGGAIDSVPPADGGLPVNPHNDTSALGTNLTGISDWTTEWPFVDAFKISRAWISGSSSAWDDGRSFDLDQHGWVRSLASDQIARTLIFWSGGDEHPAGRYHVLYEGAGTIEYHAGATKNDALSTPGHDVLDVDPAAGGIGINITAVSASNHLRNIRVIMPGGVCDDDMYAWCEDDFDCPTGQCELFVDNYDTQIFHPTFLDRIKTYRVLRFMDWMATNNSPISAWSERAELDDARWSGAAGVPVEIMVELANRLRADPWFCMPHLADDDFVSAFAALVADRLDPGLRVYVEHSNEVWNGIFAQSDHARSRGQALGLSTDAYQAQLYYHSRRSVEIFDLWAAELPLSQLVRVMASQAASTWVSEQVLFFEGAFENSDALGIAPYFGGYLGAPDEQARVAAMSIDDLLTELADVGLPNAVGWIGEQAIVAQDHGVELIAYEGGQHLAGHGGVENDETINALFDAANRHGDMGDLYAAYLAAWKQNGGHLFAHFVNCAGWSKWGRWGALEWMMQPRAESPKFDALQSFIEANPRWW